MIIESLKVFEAWNWLDLSLSEIVHMLGQLRRAINPTAQDPGSIDIWLIRGNLMGAIHDRGIFAGDI